ncbi:hypothetical protein [Nisaea sediminum]|uniref:hypothetical protein n=1 Tax=Nisaea sediminum TaxID=2775867 RepID=UPI0018677A6D|nr:hypothetical protein [Nisaea sediminum]
MQTSLIDRTAPGLSLWRRIDPALAALLSGAGQVLRQLRIGGPGPRIHALPEHQLRDLGLRRDMLVRERRLDD